MGGRARPCEGLDLRAEGVLCVCVCILVGLDEVRAGGLC